MSKPDLSQYIMSEEVPLPPAQEIRPGDTYQIDSEEYDSDQERDNLTDGEYYRLVEEAENGYTDEEMDQYTRQLKEDGIVNFLRSYLTLTEDGEMRSLRKLLLGFGLVPPLSLRSPETPNLQLLPFAKVALSKILRRRERLRDLSSLDDAISLLAKSKKIIVLSGAGISTSCGIPDFRSSTGLYAQLQEEGKYELDDPQQMFDIRFFREKPEVFYSFAKQIYPSNFVPSPCHRWIKMLEDRGVLLRNYTQNIDTLESLAGVERVLQCHGSFKSASCLRCKHRVPGRTIEPYIMSQQIPYCGSCREICAAEREARRAYREKLKKLKAKAKGKSKADEWDDGDDDEDDESADEWGGGEPGIIKPDITFFGQALDSEFDECLFKDREEVDLLVVIGTSLKVAPVSEVLTHIPHSVPQIFINLTPVYHVQPDVSVFFHLFFNLLDSCLPFCVCLKISLLGDADSIVTYLSDRLGWPIPPPTVLPTPPSAIGEGKSEEIASAGQNDEIKMERATHVVIPPEEAQWLTVDEERHFHLLRRKGDPAIQAETTVTAPVVPSSPKPEPFPQPQPQSAGNTTEQPSSPPPVPMQVGEAEEGYVSDEEDEADEPPRKRSKVVDSLLGNASS
ncbi:NAD-dependent histone deacetylase SIR2 [Cryptococcus neoformans Tu259-1]|uniref:NAD-dependent histone deacetylase SIR2 n=1 Tax=Cryptococcus neoformans Tu259-1 TaxID=1230072 RepID=A0A854Q7P6_CRYNE|nr:NAD-dependent histone deacetylase SIR2 [Cryptococcus neoformans var. grubii Tu259-1]